MSVFCHYHPTKPAHWACAGCNLTLCPDCVTRRDRGELLTDESIYLCPKCGREVGWLNETGKSKASITAFNRLTKAYPRHQLVPKTYFRAAQVFHDRLMNPRQAKKILNGLIKKYPDHEIIGQVKSYLGHL